MAIQGIPPGLQPLPWQNGPAGRSQRSEQPAKPPEPKAPSAPPQPAPVEQTLRQQLEQLSALSQTRSEVSEINQTLQQAQQDLENVNQERLQELFGLVRGEGSPWEVLSLQEKAYQINRLKDKIKDLELERSALVTYLRDQVLSGAYRVSGAQILQGMIEDFNS